MKDLHAIIDKLNKTLEIFNGISHKTVKSLRKQLLYLKDKFKNIEQSLKLDILVSFQLKIYLKNQQYVLYVKDYAVKDVLTKQVLEKFKSLIFISGTLNLIIRLMLSNSYSTKMFTLIHLKLTHRYKVQKMQVYLYRVM